jgi:hypothetical protein
MVACTLPDPPYDYALEPAISGQIQARASASALPAG